MCLSRSLLDQRGSRCEKSFWNHFSFFFLWLSFSSHSSSFSCRVLLSSSVAWMRDVSDSCHSPWWHRNFCSTLLRAATRVSFFSFCSSSWALDFSISSSREDFSCCQLRRSVSSCDSRSLTSFNFRFSSSIFCSLSLRVLLREVCTSSSSRVRDSFLQSTWICAFSFQSLSLSSGN